MKREDLADLSVFIAVTDDGNFTRATARLGVSQKDGQEIVKRISGPFVSNDSDLLLAHENSVSIQWRLPNAY